jgi:zinc protease
LKAINAAIVIMKDMTVNEISDTEYENAKSFWTGFYPMMLETPSQVANELLKVKLYGLSLSYIKDFTRNIDKVDKSDIRDIARKLIDTDNMVFVVVCNAADVEEDLKKLGDVTVENIDEL